MASLSALLAAYDLDSGDVIHVDTGTYHLVKNIRLEAQDSGVTIQGPDNRGAILDRDSRVAGAYVVELAGADDVTLSHLTFTDAISGVYARGEDEGNAADSDRTTITDSTFNDFSGASVRVGRRDDGIRVTGSLFGPNIRTAIEVYGDTFAPNGSVIDGNTILGFHGGTAIYMTGAQGSRITNNDITGPLTFSGDNAAIRANLQSGGTSEQIVVSGNYIHDIPGAGIVGGGRALFEGNTVERVASWGMAISDGGEARSNFVRDNGNGIQVSGGTLSGNRVVHNAGFGIQIFNGGVVTGNTIYANRVGVHGTGFFSSVSGQIANNVIYQNLDQGVQINVASGLEIANNTIVQLTGDAVRIQAGSTDVRVRNNIIEVSAGTAISLAGDSVINVRSDYNDLHVTGTGRLAAVDARAFTSLADWFFELGQDQHSLTADPLFVDPDGADDLLGYVWGLRASYYANETLSGLPILERIEDRVEVGLGYDAPAAGLPADGFSVRWQGYLYVPTDGQYSFFTSTDEGERLYLDGSMVIDQWPWDFGVEQVYQATLSAGLHTLAYEMHDTTGPASAVLRWEGPGIGKQVIAGRFFSPLAVTPGDYGGDDNFHTHRNSPVIDAGDPASPFSLEPAPNGGRVNIGADGNTPSANPSPAEVVQILAPAGLEKFEAGQQVTIRWRSFGLAAPELALADLDLVAPGQSNSIASIAGGTANDGDLVWTIPASVPLNQYYQLRVRLGGHEALSQPIQIVNAGTDYYVNDGSTVGDVFTSAPGDNAASGKDSAHPMASISALIAAYDLDPGDIIHVDTGTYHLVKNIRIETQDSGVTIQGPENRGVFWTATPAAAHPMLSNWAAPTMSRFLI